MDARQQLRRILESAASGAPDMPLALSGGLDSSIMGYCFRDSIPEAVSVIAQDFVATDLAYCQMAAGHLGLRHEILSVGTPDMLDAIEESIRILGVFNDIEIRNAAVIYLALSWAKSHGYPDIITGDGADELFAGYDYMLKKPEERIPAELGRMRKIMHFSSTKIARALGMRVRTPFLDEAVVDISSHLPVSSLVGMHGGERYGKYILREAFEDMLPPAISWRPKSAMQDGAGTAGLAALFQSVISDARFQDEAGRIGESDGITIRTKESLHYYLIYRRIFGVPEPCGEPQSCPYCHGCILENSRFCRMCGAFPV